MFKENRKHAAATDTLIGQGTCFRGVLKSDAAIRVEGECQGDIECQSDVIIGECGVAKSGISARDVIVAGQVYGDVVTRGRLTITSSGQLHGNVTAHALLIHEGGTFNGECRMESDAKAAESGDKPRSADAGDASANPQNQQARDKEKNGSEKARQAG